MFFQFRIELNCINLRGKRRKRVAKEQATTTTTTTKSNGAATTAAALNGRTTTTSNNRCFESNASSPHSPPPPPTNSPLYMAKNYQLTYKLSRYKWTNRAHANSTFYVAEQVDSTTITTSSHGAAAGSSLTASGTYVATCATRRESVAVKITDLDEINDFQLILVRF